MIVSLMFRFTVGRWHLVLPSLIMLGEKEDVGVVIGDCQSDVSSHCH